MALAISEKLVDVTGIEPATPCLQSKVIKTLNALSGVAYTEIHKIFAPSNVPKLYRGFSGEPRRPWQSGVAGLTGGRVWSDREEKDHVES